MDEARLLFFDMLLDSAENETDNVMRQTSLYIRPSSIRPPRSLTPLPRPRAPLAYKPKAPQSCTFQ